MENLTAEQILTKMMLDLRELRPFYSGVYEVLKKEPRKMGSVFAFTSKKIYYNPDLMAEMDYEELLYYGLQIVVSLSLKYYVRQEGRDSEVWRRAYTIYVNQLLGEEFGFREVGESVVFGNISIKMPENALFSNEIDLERDYVEKIYAVLMGMEENSELEEILERGGGSESEGVMEEFSEDEESFGESGGDSGENGDESLEFYEEMEESQDEEGEKGEEEEKEEKYLGKENVEDVAEEEEKSSELEEEGEKEGELLTEKEDKKDEKEEKEENRKKKKHILQGLEDFSNQLEKEREAEKLLKEAAVRTAMLRESSGIGDCPSLLEREVEKLFVGRVDWRKLLRQYLRASDCYDLSFSAPDKRYFCRDMIMAGEIWEEPDCLEEIKICVDTSGSISEERLGAFLGQVETLFRQFRVSGELIFWDVEIEKRMDFSEFRHVKYEKAVGGGGTDPDCLFRYFESKECKVKPLVVLILTDGYVGKNFEEESRKRKFKQTIWVMTEEYHRQFQPSFGKVAVPKFD